MFRGKKYYRSVVKIQAKLKICLISSILLFTGLVLIAQNHEDGGGEDHQMNFDHGGSGHKITLFMANSLINNSFSDQTNGILIVPAFGLNYDYFFNSRWGIGVHTDLLLQQFKVEKPVSSEEMVLFKPHHRWMLMTGYGVEVEKHANYQMIRTGIEYGIQQNAREREQCDNITQSQVIRHLNALKIFCYNN